MKKILGLSALALAGVLAFTGCSCNNDKVETYTGSYNYDKTYSGNVSHYGCAVTVEVEDGKIVSVKTASDEKTGWANVTPSWADKANWVDGEEAFLESFVGMTVEEVMAINVKADADGAPLTFDVEHGGDEEAITGIDIVTEATQSSGRTILAIQDALREYEFFK